MLSELNHVRSEIRSGLEAVYQGRMRGVYVFGSYARGDYDAESDLDVLVVLEDFASYGQEVDRTAHLVAHLSLRYGISLSLVFVRERDWQSGDTPFLRNLRREVIAA